MARTPAAVPGRKPAPHAKVRGVRLAFGFILLNIVVQIITFAMVIGGRMEASTAIQLSVWTGLAMYGTALAMSTGPLFLLRPQWLRGDPKTARLLGAEIGFLVAGVLIAIGWAATGEPLLDPGSEALVSEGSILRILLAFGAIAVVAPVVEELLFRGVVAESLRRRGAVVAVFVSSLMFSLAHLHWNLAGVLYFTLCGVVLGILYWRRGLWASIACHAVFNGSLVLIAVLVALGPSHLLTNNGVSVNAPSGWRLANAMEAPDDAQLTLSGPSGSSMIVNRVPVPAGTHVSVDALLAKINSGSASLPLDSSIDGPAKVTAIPAGTAVEVRLTIRGQKGVLLLLPRADEVWEVAVATGGSARAVRTYPQMLQSLTLPA